MKKLTKDMIRSWKPCWDEDGPERLDDFFAPYPDGLTALELRPLLSAEDWLWVVLRAEVIPERELCLLACRFAEDALSRERAAGREPDQRSWAAIKAKRAWVRGEISRFAEDALSRERVWIVAWSARWSYAVFAVMKDVLDQQCQQVMEVLHAQG